VGAEWLSAESRRLKNSQKGPLCFKEEKADYAKSQARKNLERLLLAQRVPLQRRCPKKRP